jgi:hypothetical protein
MYNIRIYIYIYIYICINSICIPNWFANGFLLPYWKGQHLNVHIYMYLYVHVYIDISVRTCTYVYIYISIFAQKISILNWSIWVIQEIPLNSEVPMVWRDWAWCTFMHKCILHTSLFIYEFIDIYIYIYIYNIFLSINLHIYIYTSHIFVYRFTHIYR